jgi:hypothetical protein
MPALRNLTTAAAPEGRRPARASMLARRAKSAARRTGATMPNRGERTLKRGI